MRAPYCGSPRELVAALTSRWIGAAKGRGREHAPCPCCTSRPPLAGWTVTTRTPAATSAAHGATTCTGVALAGTNADGFVELPERLCETATDARGGTTGNDFSDILAAAPVLCREEWKSTPWTKSRQRSDRKSSGRVSKRSINASMSTGSPDMH